MRTMLRGIILTSWVVGLAADAQQNPVAAQFERLMGQPKEIVNNLVNFPWKVEPLDELTGFRRVDPGQSIRIGSVEKPARSHSQWPQRLARL